MKIASALSLPAGTWDELSRLAKAGDFRGTSLKRRSRSDVARVLLEYAFARFPDWEKERLATLEVV